MRASTLAAGLVSAVALLCGAPVGSAFRLVPARRPLAASVVERNAQLKWTPLHVRAPIPQDDYSYGYDYGYPPTPPPAETTALETDLPATAQSGRYSSHTARVFRCS